VAINSKNKGAVGEREACDFLEDLGFLETCRTAQHCGNTGEAPDIKSKDDRLKELHIEVKRVEKLNINKAYKQALRDTNAANESQGILKFALVMHRKNRGDWLVTMGAKDFFLYFLGKN
jgi:Holliday junction resolvase